MCACSHTSFSALTLSTWQMSDKSWDIVGHVMHVLLCIHLTNQLAPLYSQAVRESWGWNEWQISCRYIPSPHNFPRPSFSFDLAARKADPNLHAHTILIQTSSVRAGQAWYELNLLWDSRTSWVVGLIKIWCLACRLELIKEGVAPPFTCATVHAWNLCAVLIFWLDKHES